MDTQLQSISKIFTERLYRIPDYQRGYAWTEKQLKDYWGDIIQLEEGKNHYVGVLTLEKVPKETFKTWEDDSWIIISKSYEPFYVVDGQQRLTTTIILIQAIVDSVESNTKLNYTEINDIRKKYIFDSKDGGISRSYIFGYEKDNPSYEFLKSQIFNENSTSGYIDEETIYTNNLEKAKAYFLQKLSELTISEIELVFRKVTQNLLFNIYSISSDIDVFIAFETMNNRGKPLSNLELLKNRLIYLSTKFNVDETEKTRLRKSVNDSRKSVYHSLGKNKDNPLDDDRFLMNHFSIYFGKELDIEDYEIFRHRRGIHNWYRENYIEYLLEKKFSLKSIEASESFTAKNENLTVNDVYEYAESLSKSVKIWYDLFNPLSCKNFNDEEKFWFEKLSRIGINQFSPLLLTFFLGKPKKEESITLLKVLEKYAFISLLCSHRYVWHPFEFQGIAHHLSQKKKTSKEIIKILNERINQIISSPEFIDIVVDRFKSRGFYEWEGIRYFLYEYEQSIQSVSKTKKKKVDWEQLTIEREDFITVEHIYPQTARAECWDKHFKGLKPKERKSLQDSLGNLLPLSKPKNSSLQNICFQDKIDNNKNKVGFRYGSYSENEISKLTEWTPDEILKRGLHLLKFMEKHWSITLGDEEKKIEMLNLKFLTRK